MPHNERMCINISKEDADDLKIGDSVKLMVSGKVVGITKAYELSDSEDKDKKEENRYSLDLEDYSVSMSNSLNDMREKMVKEHGETDDEGM